MMESIGIGLLWFFKIYGLLTALLFVVWGLFYLSNLIGEVICCWATRKDILPENLSVRNETTCPSWLLPMLSPLLLCVFVIALLVIVLAVIQTVWNHRLVPWVTSLKFSGMDIKLLPSWISNDKLASSLNNLIGNKK